MKLLAWFGLALLVATHTANAGTVAVTVRDTDGVPIGGAVVALAGGTAAPIADKPVILDQVDEEFVPDVLVVQTGGQVVFKNSDTTRHHIYSFRQPKRFELQLAPGEVSAPLTFDQAGVVVLGCNIHDHMRAWLYVTDARFVTRTDPDGIATFANVPAGSWDARAWHARLAPGTQESVQALRVSADGRGTATFTLSLRPNQGPARHPERARY